MSEPNPFPPGFDSPAQFLSAIIDSSDDAIITKSLEGIVTSWNKGAERIFGYTSEEMVGRHISVLIPPNRQEEEPMILRRLRQGERVDHFDTRRIRKDGRELDISLTVSPVKNQAGEIVGASKIARDITDTKRAAAAITAASEETERQGRMKDEFLTTLSHELRTPLQSIVGWVQILRGGDLEEGELEQGLEVIHRNAKAQQHIIEDLLDMNRILSGKVRLDVQRVDLAAILEAALATVLPSAEAKSIRVHSVLDPLSKPVSGDPQRLQQVFWNLFSNAIKFTPKGGRIEVLLKEVNSHLEVSVADTGKGISGEFLPYVFDRFRQADASTTRSDGGLGLGLAIVKHLVELHGGSVQAASSGPGLGSTFRVILPVAAVYIWPSDNSPETSLDDVRNVLRQPKPTIPQLPGVSVLVVDDDEDSRQLIARTLTKSGASVCTASGVDEGLRRISESIPDVIVSDVGMPGKNGYTFLEDLRTRSADHGGRIPAVALTAYTRVEDRIRALGAGFQMVLPKPVDAAELVATVSSLAKQTR